MRILLWPFALLYGFGLWLRNKCFDIGLLKEHKFSVPVICVGNLKVGGTGKSPLVIYLAKLLKEKNKVAVLSRGYGRISKGYRIVQKNDSAALAGDEPLQYAQLIPGITVAVCESRVEGIENLLSAVKPDLILLDDAYQHRYVKAGLNILLTEYNHLYTKDNLLPVGKLRESASGAKRADIIIVTKCPSDFSSDKQNAVKNELKLKLHQQIYFTYIRYREYISMMDGSTVSITSITDHKVILLTGIADPSSLKAFVETHFTESQSVVFPDHHIFSVGDIINLRQKFDKFVAADKNAGLIITTRKDEMRLQQPELKMLLKDLPVAVIDIDIEFTGGSEKFNQYITTYVKSH